MSSEAVFGSRTMTRCLALFLFSGTTLVQVSLILGSPSASNRGAVGVFVLIYPVAAALFVRGDRMPMKTLQALLAAASMIAGIAVGACRQVAPPTALMFFAWTAVVAATFFFSWQAAIGHLSITTRRTTDPRWYAEVPRSAPARHVDLCHEEGAGREAGCAERWLRPDARDERARASRHAADRVLSRTHRGAVRTGKPCDRRRLARFSDSLDQGPS